MEKWKIISIECEWACVPFKNYDTKVTTLKF